ncbi:hypothetical protein QBC34DRAFT_54433 [Podospora aff. communis PSN243]|uniref:Heterokaryon incompatibility domain-containing protein n=1 Tax=Podospora aff. communis PSN243 TaxID=3040156 RepID=A0AAV9GRE1_9PEZI|nr:hypothetical protein QBC34DRAFT_54433 [Podospora aff. communis PSN243]
MRHLTWPWILETCSNLWMDDVWNTTVQAPETTVHHRAVKALLCYDRELDDTDGLWDQQFDSALEVLGRYEETPEDRDELGLDTMRRFTSKTDRKSLRALYTTWRRGLIGLAPPLTRIGDLVCIIHGSRTPVILRKSVTPGRFYVLGQSYLEGWMHGEHIWWREEDAMVFELE